MCDVLWKGAASKRAEEVLLNYLSSWKAPPFSVGLACAMRGVEHILLPEKVSSTIGTVAE